jgi:hypothetical protein
MADRDPEIAAALDHRKRGKAGRVAGAAAASAAARVEAALQPVVVREVVEPEVLPRAEPTKPAKPPVIGERVMGRDELIERLSAAARDDEHPAHVLALKVLSDYYLAGEIEQRKVEARHAAQEHAAARKRARGGSPSRSVARARVDAIMGRRAAPAETDA